MPNYIAHLREHLEATRVSERDYEKEAYQIPGFSAVYDALMITQGKQRNRAKEHKWNGPTAFSPELSDLVEQHRARIVDVYRHYSTAAERAKNLMYHGNLRLVPKFANCYDHPDLSLLDKVQEGNIGLQRGVEMYDYRLAKFSTHAFQWIRAAIQRAYTNAGPVHLPSHVHETVSLVSKVQKVKREKGEDGTRGNAIKWISDGEVKSPSCDIEMALSRYRSGKGVLRFDAPKNDEDDTLLHDKIGDSAMVSDVIYEAKEREEIIAGALDELDERQRLIIQLRYQLHPDYDEELTQTKVGQVIGCSKNVVANLERKALNALREEHGVDLRIFM